MKIRFYKVSHISLNKNWIYFFLNILDTKMASKEETDKKSLIIMKMANRELRQDVMMALILISNKKETFNNLD